jgi:hypothetical protein
LTSISSRPPPKRCHNAHRPVTCAWLERPACRRRRRAPKRTPKGSSDAPRPRPVLAASPFGAAGSFPPSPRWRLATRRLVPSRLACQRTAVHLPEGAPAAPGPAMSSLICRGGLPALSLRPRHMAPHIRTSQSLCCLAPTTRSS